MTGYRMIAGIGRKDAEKPATFKQNGGSRRATKRPLRRSCMYSPCYPYRPRLCAFGHASWITSSTSLFLRSSHPWSMPR